MIKDPGRPWACSVALLLLGLAAQVHGLVPAYAPAPGLSSNRTAPARSRWVPGRLLVRFNQNVTHMNRTEVFDEIARIVESIDGIDLDDVFKGSRIVVVNITDGTRAVEMASRLNLLDVVDFAEPDYYMRPDQNPGSSWGLSKLNVYDVWNKYTAGDCKTLVCHIDSGMQYTAYTQPRYWYNSGEYAGKQGVDDDQNGVIDDFHGFNAVGQNNDTFSFGNTHGTQTASALIAVSPRVSIMPCRALDDNNDIPYSRAISCIEWCKTNYEAMRFNGGNQATGIYSLSWGGDTVSQAVSQSIKDADTTGVSRAIFLASAGNQQGVIHFPASGGFYNVIAVTDSDQNDRVIGNKGGFVDIAAPGGSTSEATPTAAGVVALMVSANKALAPDDLKAAIITTGDPISGVKNGRLNASKAFKWLADRGRVATAASAPTQATCVPADVWYPPYPAGQQHCNQVKYDRGCWSVA